MPSTRKVPARTRIPELASTLYWEAPVAVKVPLAAVTLTKLPVVATMPAESRRFPAEVKVEKLAPALTRMSPACTSWAAV